MERLGRVVGRTSFGLLLGVAVYAVLFGFFPRVELAMENWFYAHQSHKDSEGAAAAPLIVLPLGGGALGLLSAFVPRRNS